MIDIPVSWVIKLKQREGKGLAQGHTVGSREGVQIQAPQWEFTQGTIALSYLLMLVWGLDEIMHAKGLASA